MNKFATLAALATLATFALLPIAVHAATVTVPAVAVLVAG